MKKQYLSLITVLTVLLVLPACNVQIPGNALDCRELTEEAVRPVDFDTIDLGGIRQWALQNYQVNESDVSSYDVSEEPGRRQHVTWNHADKVYNAYFVEGQWKYLWVRWESWRPTGEQVLSCFGPPDSYGAYYISIPHGFAVELELWYPDQGILIRFPHKVDTGLGDPPPPIQSEWTARHLYFVRPGPIDDVIRDAYATRADNVNAETLNLKPWPGDWERLEIDIVPP